jgi:hypothetical protein
MPTSERRQRSAVMAFPVTVGRADGVRINSLKGFMKISP